MSIDWLDFANASNNLSNLNANQRQLEATQKLVSQNEAAQRAQKKSQETQEKIAKEGLEQQKQHEQRMFNLAQEEKQQRDDLEKSTNEFRLLLTYCEFLLSRLNDQLT